MYRSKLQIEKKIKQVNFVTNEIHKFRDRIFVNDGIDPETGAHPLITHMSSFLAHARSIIQYAYKEANESGKLSAYERYVKGIKIFKLFKDVRDSDIHEYTIGVHSIMYGNASLDPATSKSGVIESKPITMVVEELKELNNQKKGNSDVSVKYSLCKRVKVTDELLMELEAEGKQDLLKAVGEGKELYDPVDFLGNSDVHDLCDIYVEELNRFVEHGVKNGFIS